MSYGITDADLGRHAGPTLRKDRFAVMVPARFVRPYEILGHSESISGRHYVDPDTLIGERLCALTDKRVQELIEGESNDRVQRAGRRLQGL
jgi:hypothetical protein